MAELAADDPHSIGGYRLLSRLGAGGMGRVYLARSEGGRTVAVKLIKPELAAEKLFRSRFRLEVEAARRVGRRWTAPVLDADTEADAPWVATGYIAGPSLDQVVSARVRDGEGPLPEQSVRTLAYGLGSALLDIHGAGLVHRDLKPSNILVTIDGPRVIDFGIARALDELTESTLTSTGVVVGSPSYMSPEQIRSEPVTPASDVFCLGAVLAYAGTARPPFGNGGGSGGMHSVMFRIAQEAPDLEGLTDPLHELVAACLDKDPAARPAPEEVVAGVQPIPTGTAAAPWLPAGLLAELGRHAVQLLDTDTPPSGCGAPSTGQQRSGQQHTGYRPGEQQGEQQGHEQGLHQGHQPGLQPGGEPGQQPGHEATGQVGSGSTPAEPASERLTSVLPSAPDGERGGGPAEVAATQSGPPAGSRPRRRPYRRAALVVLATLAAVLVAGTAAVVSGGQLPLLGFGGRSDDSQGSQDSSDVPAEYVGTWSGPVTRGGEPTGQYRRFVISRGQLGEVVANSTSLGVTYECQSDGKLSAVGHKGESLDLDTKVVKSVPEKRCSALGSHTLSKPTGSTLTWQAAGRTAILHKVKQPEKLPAAYRGRWQRPVPGGSTQTLTVRQLAVDGRPIEMLSTGPGLHCEASADLFSAGAAGTSASGTGAGAGTGTGTGTSAAAQPVRIGPPALSRHGAQGQCVTGHTSTLRIEGDRLIREWPDGGAAVTYTRAR